MQDIIQKPVFPLCYTGCIWYYSALLKHPEVLIELNEFVPKQTTRTFLEIISANGLQKLSIPVNNKAQKIPYKLITIDNKQRWQHQHWQSIVSAYNSSPFFEHYQHLFEPVYSKPYDLLVDFNIDLFKACVKALKIKTQFNFTENYLPEKFYVTDFRNAEIIKKTRLYSNVNYCQVFSYKHEFINNLSVLDLIFNLGPQAQQYLLNTKIS